MKRNRCLVLLCKQVPRHVPWLTSALLAASCLTPLPMMRWHRPLQRGSLVGLVAMAAWLAVPPRATAQSCSTSGEAYSCTIPPGTYSSAVTVNTPTDGAGNALQTTVTSQGAYTVAVPVNQGPAFIVEAAGQNGIGGGNAGAGGNGQGITIDTQGNLTLTNTSWSGTFLFGLYASLIGGDGGGGSKSTQGGDGGNTGNSSDQILNLTNSGTITIDLPSVTVGGGAALYAFTQGGQGGQGDDGAGGTGGQATGATINNSGAINVTLAGSNGFAGIQALGFGGNAGTTGKEGGNVYGGAGGPNSVTSSGAVTVDWTWKNATTPNFGLYGISAQTTGGNGALSNESGTNGGDGGYNPQGAVHTASVTLTAGGDVTVTATGSPVGYALTTGKTSGFNGAGVAAILIGGNGGDLDAEEAHAGNAGWAGTAPGVLSGQITVTDANVTTSGDNLPGLLVLGQGGSGGNALMTSDSGNRLSAGGDGGFAGDSRIQVSTSSGNPVTIQTGGTNSAGVVNWLQAGAGGSGGTYNNIGTATTAGAGGNGGPAGQVEIILQGQAGAPVKVITTGDNSAGVQAISQGAAGGVGGDNTSEVGSSAAGNGGGGGQGGAVTVSLASTSISTSGDNSPGIFAASTGAAGGGGGISTGGFTGVGGSGGAGGTSMDVTVMLDSGSSIITTGSASTGIVAQTLSGAGGGGGFGDGTFKAVAGNGGAGGNTGNISITNNGTIQTTGDSARGIIGLAMSGVGGTGGSTYGVTYSAGGSGKSGGTVGTVTIDNRGSVSTAGKGAHAILGQSIAGGGGAGGDASGTVVAIGGNASTNPFAVNGNVVQIEHTSGSIATSGVSAIGILGQSIGGGGGDGGTVSDGTYSIGGAGGAGGAGGQVVGNVNGQISTSGDGAHGIAMQSIGGGGGNGGNATADSIFEAYSVGGTGGSGGNGGPATIDMSNGKITTTGAKAAGLVVQSIGGGGGTGGQAISGSVGAGFSTATAIGGSGGSGGQASQVSSQMVGGSITTGQTSLLGGTGPSGSCSSLPCNQLPVDAYGAVIQSIGGGGGAGGSASAKALAIAIPVTPDGDQIGVSAGSAVGGSGGSGGSANYVTFAVSQGGTITTNGQGSTGVLLQSIGGGGGAGGDSSALAAVIGYGTQDLPDDPNSLSVEATFSVGGMGGSGGNGGAAYMALGGLINVSDGTVTFTPDAPGSPKSNITTYGDFANGVKAQSIGGGGGDAGFGSGNTQDFGTGTNLSLNVSLGATGGDGGTGGQVIVDLSPTSSITTWGSNAMGVVAQSIGGGGGTSQGGSYSFGGPLGPITPKVKFQIGTQGGGGGSGGDVRVDVQGPITTHGGDATGVLAQSIGGGGGVGGSAGSDASADNPIVEGLNIRKGLSNIGSQSASFNLTATLAIGGTGGSGGNGGSVLTQLSAPITTTGDWAPSVVAQSIGGGGGKGGNAVATGTGGKPDITINLDLAVGGTGGAGGVGGPVTVNLNPGNTNISTAGFGAAGVIAQSVGGGGGIGADGSDSATGLLSVGESRSGFGGTGGNGGTVQVNYANSNSTTITTTGQAADGVILQSIGGGGGIAGAGSSVFVSAFKQSGTLSLSAGGGSNGSGDGGTVTFTAQPSLTISTTGNDSFGILAQSIGGGGGIVTSQPSASSVNFSIGGWNSSGNGGPVSVQSGSVTTTGIGAHGIVAQSIGGGGGVIRLANAAGDSPVLSTPMPSTFGTQNASNGTGGPVTVNAGDSISVAGAGAIGIFAQSVGGGGGLVHDGNTIYAGSPDTAAGGGTVAVTVNGSVSATGPNGIGIFAQSTGSKSSEEVSVTVSSTVTGGSGPGSTLTQGGSSAIQIDSPSGSNNGKGNQVTVTSGGTLTTVSGTAGTAILASGGGYANVTNDGTITGSTYLNVGTMDNGGTFNPGADVQGKLVNNSIVNLGMPGSGSPMTTHVTGDFIQTGGGQLNVIVDSVNKAVSQLRVDGTAHVAGTIVPTAVTLLPGPITVLTAGSLNLTGSAQDSLLFDWSAIPAGNSVALSPASTFAPQGVPLTASRSSLAGYLTRAWNNSDAAFATRFAEFSRLNDAGQYITTLDAYSGKAAHAQSIALVNSAGAILGAAMSCPVFVERSVLLGEDNCVWAKGAGRWSNQSATGDTQGYDVSSATYRIGVQHQIAPDWYLGASFAAGKTWATMSGTVGGNSSGDGHTFDGSVSLKHTMGPWFVAGSVAFASGSFQTDRLISFPGESALLKGDPSIFLAAGRLRGGYQFVLNDWYIRPYGDLDVIHSNLAGFREAGPALYALDVRESSKTSVVLSPMVEFGGRLALDEETTLRPFVAVGVSFLPDNTHAIDASFVGAFPAHGTFRNFIKLPEVLGNFDLGVQLYRADGFEVKAEYKASIGGSFLSQRVSGRLAYHF